MDGEPASRHRATDDAPTPTAPSPSYLAGFTARRAASGCRRSPGGAVGFFGYDLVRTVEPLGEPNPDPLGLPDMALMICELMLAFDHQQPRGDA